MTDLAHVPAVSADGALDWLRAVLWSSDVDVEFTAGGNGDLGFLAEPSASRPQLLVPDRPAAAVAAVARRSSDARSLSGRLRTTAVEMVARAGLVPRLAPGRIVSLWLGEGTDDPHRSLPAHVRSVLDLDEIVFAVTLGGERYNRKPVLTVFDGRGRLMAFVKVGADDLTDRYVRNEGRWLSEIDSHRPGDFRAPELLWSGDWRDRPVVVSAPVRPPRLPVRLSISRPPHGLVEAIASVAATEPAPVAGTTVIEAAAELDDAGIDLARTRVLDRHADVKVRVGLWHGDLSPWNLASRRRRPPLVWDWEAAADGRPVGGDLLHSIVMVATHLRGTPPAEAIAALGPDDVGDHQEGAGARAAALDLYLLDVACRDQQIIADGVDASLLPGIGGAARQRLVGEG